MSFLKRYLKNPSLPAEYADVFVEHRKPTSIQLEDDKIKKYSQG